MLSQDMKEELIEEKEILSKNQTKMLEMKNHSESNKCLCKARPTGWVKGKTEYLSFETRQRNWNIPPKAKIN